MDIIYGNQLFPCTNCYYVSHVIYSSQQHETMLNWFMNPGIEYLAFFNQWYLIVINYLQFLKRITLLA